MGYVEALALTQIVEAPIYCALLWGFARVRPRSALLASIGVNLVTHPLLHAVLLPLAGRVVPPRGAILIGELIVCALEAGLLYAWLRREPLAMLGASLIANGSSLATGLLLFAAVPPLR